MEEEMQTMRIYRSTRNQLKRLVNNPELYVQCAEALFDYGLDGLEHESEDLVVSLFMDAAKPNCDSYKKAVNSHREAGKKGGRPKKVSYDTEQYKEKARGIIEYKPKETKENQNKANES